VHTRVSDHGVVTLFVEDPLDGEDILYAIGSKAMIDAVMIDLIMGNNDAMDSYLGACAKARMDVSRRRQ
jgi:hypothetical protein